MGKTISIDFDGVIHDYSNGWTGYVPTGEPIPEALDFIMWCLDQDIEIFISSCRAYTQTGRLAILKWLEHFDFPVQYIHVTCEKPHAEWYVDDRAIRFKGSFDDVRDEMKLPVWFKKTEEPSFREK